MLKMRMSGWILSVLNSDKNMKTFFFPSKNGRKRIKKYSLKYLNVKIAIYVCSKNYMISQAQNKFWPDFKSFATLR